jgi:hypothetical protein
VLYGKTFIRSCSRGAQKIVPRCQPDAYGTTAVDSRRFEHVDLQPTCATTGSATATPNPGGHVCSVFLCYFDFSFIKTRCTRDVSSPSHVISPPKTRNTFAIFLFSRWNPLADTSVQGARTARRGPLASDTFTKEAFLEEPIFIRGLLLLGNASKFRVDQSSRWNLSLSDRDHSPSALPINKLINIHIPQVHHQHNQFTGRRRKTNCTGASFCRPWRPVVLLLVFRRT